MAGIRQSGIGGNSIVRRKWFDRAGLYSESLGRSGTRLPGGEDSRHRKVLVWHTATQLGRLLRAPFRWFRALSHGNPADLFHHELTLWRFAGLFHGVRSQKQV